MAAAFERAHVDTLCERLAEPPARLIALFGPRRTGKTTIALQALRRTDRNGRRLAVDEPEPSRPRPPFDSAATLTAPRQRDIAWLVHHWEQARYCCERVLP